MGIKLVAFDMDYTMLRTGGALSEFSEKTLAKAEEQGILLVPTTGRGLSELEDGLLEKLKAGYLVLVNGALVYDVAQKKIIYRELPDQDEIIKKLELALSMGIYAEAYCGEIYTSPYCYDNMKALGMPEDQVPMFKKTRKVEEDFVGKMKERRSIEKLHLIFRDVPDKIKRQAVFLGHPDFSYTAAYVNNLELCSKKVNKATGLQALTERLSINPEEVMALGDGANDACMLRWAGLGVAVENAVPEAKAAADALTLSNDEDGAALAIEKWVLNKESAKHS